MRWPWTFKSLTADAQILAGPAPKPDTNDEAPTARSLLYRTPEAWQREVWDFYDTLGEFRQGITWKANMMSRVRLRAARRVPGQDEPEIVDKGTANDIVADLGGGVGGQAQLMADFAVYMDGPGECYLMGETLPSGKNKWYTRSLEEARPTRQDPKIFEVVEWGNRWRRLPNDSLAVRVWRPHKRVHYVADSPARAARVLMRELELLNRHIQAQYLSRLASAGVLILPTEASIPVRPEFLDAADPFTSEWVEIAAEAIKTPGSAAALVPIPIRIPAELVQYVKHIDFTLTLDDKIIQKRDSALSRLAIELDMPPEALLGTRDVNHWNAWLIDEQGVKIHVSPTVEVVCDALTVGFLAPMLTAAVANGANDVGDIDNWVMWYDASELILRPDRSEAAKDDYDRGELTGEALRRETGFDESDKPDDEELRRIILVKSALSDSGVNTFAAMDELGLKTAHDMAPPAVSGEGEQAPQAPPSADDRNPPEQNPSAPPEKPAPPAKQAAAERDNEIVRMAGLPHFLQVGRVGEDTQVVHPADCTKLLRSCPVTHALAAAPGEARPGAPGLYATWLSVKGIPIIGQQVHGVGLDNGDWVRSRLPAPPKLSRRPASESAARSRNGHTREPDPTGTR